MTQIEDKVKAEMDKIIDPETGLTFGQMQIISGVKEQSRGVVKIDFVPTSPFCPIAFKFAQDIKNAAKKVPGVTNALVYCHGHNMEKAINEAVNKE
jgi:metal-sulfur cluster biosynthetic enzyme